MVAEVEAERGLEAERTLINVEEASYDYYSYDCSFVFVRIW